MSTEKNAQPESSELFYLADKTEDLSPRHACLRAKSLQSSQPYGLESTSFLCPWDSPSRNTRVSYHALLQGTFPTQGSNPGLLHRQEGSSATWEVQDTASQTVLRDCSKEVKGGARICENFGNKDQVVRTSKDYCYLKKTRYLKLRKLALFYV